MAGYLNISESELDSEEMKLKQTTLSNIQKLVLAGKKLGLSTLIFLTVPTAPTLAQVNPDESLPTERSTTRREQIEY